MQDDLVFEGEFLDGQEWNGKKYDLSGNLIFEGEYLYGQKNGKGKEYGYYYLQFEGEYMNDKRLPLGIDYDSFNLVPALGEYTLTERSCEEDSHCG